MERQVRDYSRWNFKLLQAFTLVAEHGSFKRAAEESFRSHSAVSAQVKELEAQLGVALFERTTRRVTLTPQGAELLEHARKAFSQLSVGLANVQEAADRNSHRVRFACVPAIFHGALSPALANFERQHPDVLTTAMELLSEPLVAAVKSGEAEFGIGAKIPSAECEFEHLFEDEVYAIVSRRNHSLPESEITVSELVTHPILLPRPATLVLSVLEREALRQRTFLNLRHHFNQAHSVVSMAAAGHGIGIVAGLLIKSMNYRNVRFLRVTNPVIMRDVSVVTRRGATLSQPDRALLKELKVEVLRYAAAQP
ncbi:MAG: LysR family transcriptional regulator [Hyphomicrobiaceae bacterium]|nr:LysR family transcriptional regulator [Hyphomicrobiaceae bacterium]